MARPQKNGLDYFPLDVDIDQDDKVALIEAQHGITGFAIVIKLLMKIYKNSYFYEWTEKEQLLFSKRVNVDINQVNVVINDCVKWGLFEDNLLKTHKILTSKGIQRRYLEAVGRRQKVEMSKEYLLLDKDIVNVYKNLVIVNINDGSEVVNVDINPQSKVKESKVKESKEEKTEKSSCSSFENKDIYSIYEECGFGLLNKMLMEMIDADIELYSKEWLIDAMKEAVKQGKYKYSYVEGILRNWKTNGKEKTNGTNERYIKDPDREGIGLEL
ncbi:DUF4373 domain-containing protein [Clostridium algidicarnis]|uniref:Lin1244/Lin1753 domain-containing protein n=1 Tax=Clostridium algidicarnis TaxID=37659 RepID=UPI001C0E7B03|nr:Lin1244/Lin1753 domain-containing protein [Clostridium algidicarnis]MBU3195685.1 DUF4373 domain-containing protein [Clostridium algidicarnis]